jgi:hypothetical protein
MIDWDKKYSKVANINGGNYYLQDGVKFAMNGEPLPGEKGSGAQPPKEPPLEEMHWTNLKKQVEAAGGEWTNKEDALAFLQAEGEVEA